MIKHCLPFLLVLIGLSTNLYAAPKVAKVLIMKGTVTSKTLKSKKGAKIKRFSNEKKIKRGEWVTEGSVITTKAKSFVKFLFKDQSQMTLGPNSQMEITQFSQDKKDPSVYSLIKGKLRSKITKDLIGGTEKSDKTKLFIKTRSAAMGVRGTEFLTNYNPQLDNTACITFEGEVAMAKIDDAIESAPPEVLTTRLETAISSDTAVSITEGKFAGTSANTTRPNVPVKLSPTQFHSLKGNDNMESASSSKAAQSPAATTANVLPPGVSAQAFTAQETSLSTGIAEAVGAESIAEVVAEVAPETGESLPPPEAGNEPPPEGMYNASTGEFAPKSGGVIDLNSGGYIPPPQGAAFDATTGTFVFSAGEGFAVDPDTGEVVVAPQEENQAGGQEGNEQGQQGPNGEQGPPGQQGQNNQNNQNNQNQQGGNHQGVHQQGPHGHGPEGFGPPGGFGPPEGEFAPPPEEGFNFDNYVDPDILLDEAVDQGAIEYDDDNNNNQQTQNTPQQTQVNFTFTAE